MSDTMFKNMRQEVSLEKLEDIIDKYKDDSDVFLLQIDGSELITKRLFYEYMDNHLNVPHTLDYNWAAYRDIMTDQFTYYDKKEIVITIKDYDYLLIEDAYVKKMVQEIFDECVLPFFEDEIERVVVGGKKTRYNIYYTIKDKKPIEKVIKGFRRWRIGKRDKSNP